MYLYGDSKAAVIADCSNRILSTISWAVFHLEFSNAAMVEKRGDTSDVS